MSKHTLRFSNPPQSSSPHLNINLPDNITRRFIPTPSGTLEILCAQPKAKDDRKKALIFRLFSCSHHPLYITKLTFSRAWRLRFSFSLDSIPCILLQPRIPMLCTLPSWPRCIMVPFLPPIRLLYDQVYHGIRSLVGFLLRPLSRIHTSRPVT